jgi:hypothetical protein
MRSKRGEGLPRGMRGTEQTLSDRGIARAGYIYKRVFEDKPQLRGKQWYYLYLSDFGKVLDVRLTSVPTTDTGWNPLLILYCWKSGWGTFQVVPHPEVLPHHKDCAVYLARTLIRKDVVSWEKGKNLPED